MAFSYGSAAPGRRGPLATLSEINIIPLVDVVLVLLIIFMLTAHVMEFGLEINVPKVDTTRAGTEELPVVSITKAGELYLNGKPANINSVGEDIRRRFPTFKSAYVSADKDTLWDPIAQVIHALGKSGIEVKVVTQPLDESQRPR